MAANHEAFKISAMAASEAKVVLASERDSEHESDCLELVTQLLCILDRLKAPKLSYRYKKWKLAS